MARWIAGVVLVLGAGLGVAVDAQPAPPGQGIDRGGVAETNSESESQAVVAAHRAVESAAIEVRFSQYFSYPDETEFVSADYRIWFDRPGKRLRVERPGYTLVCDGRDVLLVADALPGRHLRTPLGDALTFATLVGIFPDLTQPLPPALVLLTAESPMSVLSGGQRSAATRVLLDDIPAEVLTLRLPGAQGATTLAMRADDKLLDSLLLEIDAQRLANSGIDAVRLYYGIDWVSVNEPIADEVFELDVSRSHEFSTLAAFLSPNGGNAQAGAGGGQGAGPGGGGGVAAGASLIGMPLVDLALERLGDNEKVNLAELNEGVVVLEFFASWSKTSVLDLPALADFRAWSIEQSQPATVYAVAVGERSEKMTKWLAALESTAGREVDLPVLLDPKTEAAMAMKLPTVPRTLIVVNGRVVEVFGGVKPTFLEDLKRGLPGWSAKASGRESAEDTTPQPAEDNQTPAPVEPSPTTPGCTDGCGRHAGRPDRRRRTLPAAGHSPRQLP
ncbi:MAG: redoxin domain-containing protein, partial [Phycisphaeraceae bacterium]